jgi:GntR family transcriptional regulator, arabinose operon transcriptional repressor
MVTKHVPIFESLKQQIESGHYGNGRRLPSEMELAKRFGVSRPTASRALRDLQNLGIIERRAGSGSYLKPQATTPAKVLKATFGLLVPGLGNTEIMDPICNEITRFSQSLGSAVLWGDTVVSPTTGEDVIALCRQFIDRKVDGVFFAPIETIADRETLNTTVCSMLTEASIAVILLDRDVLEFPQRSRFDLVGIDNFTAGFTLTEHLIAHGNREFRFLARPHYPATTDLRLAGCKEAISRAGLVQGQPLAWFGDPTDPAFVREMLLLGSPHAVLCSNDQTAAKLIQTLSNMDVRLPRDVRVAGFDDISYATLLTMPLTTIHQPCREIGQAAVRTMQKRLHHPDRLPEQVLLPFTLVIRASCGCGDACSPHPKQMFSDAAAWKT